MSGPSHGGEQGFVYLVVAGMVGMFGRDIILWLGSKIWEKCVIAVREFPYSRPAPKDHAEVRPEEVPLMAIRHI